MCIKKETGTRQSLNPVLNAVTQKSHETFNANEYLEATFSKLAGGLILKMQSESSSQKPSNKPTHRTIYSWPNIPSDRFAGQSAEQIEAIKELKAMNDDRYEMSYYVLADRQLEVRFWDNTVLWDHPTVEPGCRSYYLKNLATEVTYLGEDSSYYVYSDSDTAKFMAATAVFGTGLTTKKPQGFLIFKDGSGDFACELEEFVIASYVDNDPWHAEFDE